VPRTRRDHRKRTRQARDATVRGRLALSMIVAETRLAPVHISGEGKSGAKPKRGSPSHYTQRLCACLLACLPGWVSRDERGEYRISHFTLAMPIPPPTPARLGLELPAQHRRLAHQLAVFATASFPASGGLLRRAEALAASAPARPLFASPAPRRLRCGRRASRAGAHCSTESDGGSHRGIGYRRRDDGVRRHHWTG